MICQAPVTSVMRPQKVYLLIDVLAVALAGLQAICLPHVNSPEALINPIRSASGGRPPKIHRRPQGARRASRLLSSIRFPNKHTFAAMAVMSNGELTVEKGAKGYQVRRRRAGRLRVCLCCCRHTLIDAVLCRGAVQGEGHLPGRLWAAGD